ncbi:hypothetical protein [Pseudomonas sp. TH31]|uniref:hypothetical protein n=1 Tax=Pseudomonas sp. TH31 TaxID=2796396 RepID=UPI0019131DC9|nr:hypothetical protein [Pseudomonas sp. TH31]MBK5416384.1 hypothetical protein [Pseudomonas sp. TH31]
MSTAPVKSLIDEQLEEIEFAGKTKDSALRLAARQGFAGAPLQYGWVAPGVWLLRYKANSPS